eukprot:Skav213409  [mRNA]  locus=scaffold797:749532:750456:- [translate_table: standard]
MSKRGKKNKFRTRDAERRDVKERRERRRESGRKSEAREGNRRKPRTQEKRKSRRAEVEHDGEREEEKGQLNSDEAKPPPQAPSLSAGPSQTIHSGSYMLADRGSGTDDLTSEGECRNECRKSVQCWAYQYDSDSSTCYFAGYRCETGDPSCETETVHVKYACVQGKLCVELVTDQWYLNGQYSEAQLK